MDETVKRALQKWPNVPNVFGWLRLDRRGNWLLKVRPDQFERIGNAAVVEFIGRNYERDEAGQWYFQNGPQRVFVLLDSTPHVFRLDDARQGWLTHAGMPAGAPRELLFDDRDDVVLVTEPGPGLVLDRDLPALLDGLADADGLGLDVEALVEGLRAQGAREIRLFDAPVVAAAVAPGEIARRFGFIAEPVPA